MKAETWHQLASSICNSDVLKMQQSRTKFLFVSPPLFWFSCAMNVLQRMSVFSPRTSFKKLHLCIIMLASVFCFISCCTHWLAYRCGL